MITLVFDTETTGLPNKQLPADHPQQARIMQIAMLLLDGEKEIGCFYSLIQPANWPTPHSAATAAHGILVADCERTGLGIEKALDVFDEMYQVADIVVAHNLKFDSQLIDIENGILARPNIYNWTSANFKCTMNLMTPICGLTRKTGGAKWPNLAEAYAKCCGGDAVINAHDALGDVRSTAKVWQWLVQEGKC